MERMDMRSRNQYLKVLRERYLKVKTKKEKTPFWINIMAIFQYPNNVTLRAIYTMPR
jgi:hypothetical protein